jgi:hypothetical protein
MVVPTFEAQASNVVLKSITIDNAATKLEIEPVNVCLRTLKKFDAQKHCFSTDKQPVDNLMIFVPKSEISVDEQGNEVVPMRIVMRKLLENFKVGLIEISGIVDVIKQPLPRKYMLNPARNLCGRPAVGGYLTVNYQFTDEYQTNCFIDKVDLKGVMSFFCFFIFSNLCNKLSPKLFLYHRRQKQMNTRTST